MDKELKHWTDKELSDQQRGNSMSTYDYSRSPLNDPADDPRPPTSKREELARWLCRRDLIRQPGLPGGVEKNVDALWHLQTEGADEIIALIADKGI